MEQWRLFDAFRHTGPATCCVMILFGGARWEGLPDDAQFQARLILPVDDVLLMTRNFRRG